MTSDEPEPPPGDDAPSSPAAGPDGVTDESIGELLRTALYSRWQEPPTSMMSTRQVEMRRLADSMRIIIERMVATAAPTERLIDAADALARVALIFDEFRGTEYEGFSEAANAGAAAHASFEHSPFLGLANPIAPPIRMQEIDGKVHGRVVYGSAYEGPPGCVHGGHIAAAFDELLGGAQSLSGAPGMTGTLTIRYRSPTPLHTELHLVGEYTGIERRKIFTVGQLYAMNGDGTERLCAEAEGIFISMQAEKFNELREARERAEQARLGAG